MNNENIYKIIIIGNSNCGKTSLVNRVVNDYFLDTHNLTIGVEYASLEFKLENLISNPNIKLRIWDTAGQEKFRAITRNYYNMADGAIILFNLNNIDSFNNLDSWISEIDKVCEDIPLLIVGNKSDLEIKVNYDDITKFINKYRLNYDINYYEISVKNSINCRQIFIDLANKIYDKKFSSINDKYKTIKLEIPSLQKKKYSKKCCN